MSYTSAMMGLDRPGEMYGVDGGRGPGRGRVRLSSAELTPSDPFPFLAFLLPRHVNQLPLLRQHGRPLSLRSRIVSRSPLSVVEPSPFTLGQPARPDQVGPPDAAQPADSTRTFPLLSTSSSPLACSLDLPGALPFSGIDILYGRWASGLVNLNPDGSPPTPDYIRSISDRFAYIGIGITFGMWITTGGFFLCSRYHPTSIPPTLHDAHLTRPCLWFIQCPSRPLAWSLACDEPTSPPSSPRTQPTSNRSDPERSPRA